MNHLNDFIKSTNQLQSISSAASAKMYNDIGIKTPKIELLSKPDKYHNILTKQQLITSSNNNFFTLANEDLEFTKISKQFFGKFKWQIFYDEYLINNFLKFMTSECLEQLQNIFLIDEIRTDIDRHTKNYFFYKSKDILKYEGIIVIDLDQMIIYNYCQSSKNDFYDFLYFPYESVTPQQTYDYLCYADRVKNIRELIQFDILSPNNKRALIAALNFDLPKEIKNNCKKQHLHLKNKKNITTPIERLWDYNRNTIGKELGL